MDQYKILWNIIKCYINYIIIICWDEHPYTSYFDVHGYWVLTHTHIDEEFLSIVTPAQKQLRAHRKHAATNVFCCPFLCLQSSRYPRLKRHWSEMIISDLAEFWVYPLVNVYITMENHHFSWENPLFQWPFSIANWSPSHLRHSHPIADPAACHHTRAKADNSLGQGAQVFPASRRSAPGCTEATKDYQLTKSNS